MKGNVKFLVRLGFVLLCVGVQAVAEEATVTHATQASAPMLSSGHSSGSADATSSGRPEATEETQQEKQESILKSLGFSDSLIKSIKAGSALVPGASFVMDAKKLLEEAVGLTAPEKPEPQTIVQRLEKVKAAVTDPKGLLFSALGIKGEDEKKQFESTVKTMWEKVAQVARQRQQSELVKKISQYLKENESVSLLELRSGLLDPKRQGKYLIKLGISEDVKNLLPKALNQVAGEKFWSEYKYKGNKFSADLLMEKYAPFLMPNQRQAFFNSLSADQKLESLPGPLAPAKLGALPSSAHQNGNKELETNTLALRAMLIEARAPSVTPSIESKVGRVFEAVSRYENWSKLPDSAKARIQELAGVSGEEARNFNQAMNYFSNLQKRLAPSSGREPGRSTDGLVSHIETRPAGTGGSLLEPEAKYAETLLRNALTRLKNQYEGQDLETLRNLASDRGQSQTIEATILERSKAIDAASLGFTETESGKIGALEFMEKVRTEKNPSTQTRLMVDRLLSTPEGLKNRNNENYFKAKMQDILGSPPTTEQLSALPEALTSKDASTQQFNVYLQKHLNGTLSEDEKKTFQEKYSTPAGQEWANAMIGTKVKIGEREIDLGLTFHSIASESSRPTLQLISRSALENQSKSVTVPITSQTLTQDQIRSAINGLQGRQNLNNLEIGDQGLASNEWRPFAENWGGIQFKPKTAQSTGVYSVREKGEDSPEYTFQGYQKSGEKSFARYQDAYGNTKYLRVEQSGDGKFQVIAHGSSNEFLEPKRTFTPQAEALLKRWISDIYPAMNPLSQDAIQKAITEGNGPKKLNFNATDLIQYVNGLTREQTSTVGVASGCIGCDLTDALRQRHSAPLAVSQNPSPTSVMGTTGPQWSIGRRQVPMVNTIVEQSIRDNSSALETAKKVFRVGPYYKGHSFEVDSYLNKLTEERASKLLATFFSSQPGNGGYAHCPSCWLGGAGNWVN